MRRLAIALVSGVSLVVALGVGGHQASSGHSLPLAARGPISAALGRSDPAYRVHGMRAANPSQRFSASFSSYGTTVTSGVSRIGLRLSAIGYSGAMHALTLAAPRVAGNRVTYAHAGVREWFANGPLGLEQGFDIAAPPSAGAGALTLALSTSARAQRHGSSVLLDGHLRYGCLVVTDAQGRTLHSWLGVRGRTVTINIDDLGAAYPLRVDPFIQQAELTSADGAANDGFGISIAVSGDTIAVGASDHQVGSNATQGAVYVFTKPAAGWANAHETAELTASDGAASDQMGFHVAIDGSTIVAGASAHKVGSNANQGAAYVFVMPPSGWTSGHETAKLLASDGGVSDRFGSSVAISAGTIAVGADGFNGDRGAVYVFTGGAATWTQQAELTVFNAGPGEELGRDALAMSGGTIVAGSLASGGAGSIGKAWVFVKPSTGWADGTQTAELTTSDGAPGDQFGIAAAISGNTIAVGATGHDCGMPTQGAAYVYTMPPSGWADMHETAQLCAPDRGANTGFGGAVAVSGNNVFVGGTVGASGDQGRVYEFTMPPAGWTQAYLSAEFASSDLAAMDGFGSALGVSGTTLAVGASDHSVGANALQGTAYVFSAIAPTVAITAPAAGATYTVGQVVRAAYSCAAPALATITSCVGTVASGAAIDTSTAGTHSFTVGASDSDGASAFKTVSYTVLLPPSISSVSQSASRWRDANKSVQIARASKPPLGTTFSFTLNEPAAVTLTFSQSGSGRKVGRKCVAQNAHNKHKARCKRKVVAGTVTLAGHQGIDKVRFFGKLSSGKKLKPGRYMVVVTATIGGLTATSRPLTFTIIS
jgi:hypothetical protein